MNYAHYILQAGQLLGYVLILLIIFTESGILIGFFLPGDSLLFALGLAASQGYLSIILLIILGSIGAILGDSVGYWFGRRIGPAIFNRPDSRFFKKENMRKAHAFYEQHGVLTIVLARFTPFVRTFAPIVAGIAGMRYRTFLTYNIIGGVGWITSVSLFGYFLGKAVPADQIDKYFIVIVLGIILLSVIPAVLHLRKKSDS